VFYTQSVALLAALICLLLFGALALPLYWLLFADLVLQPVLPWAAMLGWPIGPIRVDTSDIAYVALLAGILTRRSGALTPGRIPHFWIWLLLGCAMTISYVTAPVTREALDNTVAIPYLLARYVWKPILAFPLAALLLDDRRAVGKIPWALVAAALLFALTAVPDIRSGATATGPYGSGNALAPALIPGALAATAMLFVKRRRRSWWIALACFLLLSRVMMFANSEGAFAGYAVGMAVLGLGYLAMPGMRRAVERVAVAAFLVCLVVLISKPDLFQRPNVREALQLTQGTEHENLKWRIEQRWPYFIDKTLERPWLGWGEDTDDRFGARAVTPHSSYIGIAVKHGIPTLILHVSICLLGVRNGYRLFRRSPDEEIARLGLIAVAVLAALLTHGVVDGTLTIPYVRTVMFLLAGAVSALAYAMKATKATKVEVAEAAADESPALSAAPSPGGS
jgi:hypothetical protein